MNNNEIKELEDNFQQFELSIGMNEENFGAKYIFQRLRKRLESSAGISDEELRKILDMSH